MDEQLAIDVLKEHLASQGHMVSEDETLRDDPDAVFTIGDVIVACECRHFTPERVLELHGFQWVREKLYQLFIPVEPHIWVEDAILAKAPNIKRYKANARASEVWLVIHPPTEGGLDFFMPSPQGDFAELFCLGAWRTKHDFEKIFVTGKAAEEVVCIYDSTLEDTIGKKFRAGHVERVPVTFAFIYLTHTKAGPDGKSYVQTPPLSCADRQWKFQPLDRDLYVDYSGVDAIDYANIGRGRRPPSLWATRKSSRDG